MNQKESRVLLVNPCLPSLPKEVVSTPFGLSWMSAVLKREGFNVEALDMQVEPSYEKLKSLLEPSPLLVGVSHVSNFSMGWSGRVTQYIRQILPDTPIIAGGVGATYEPRRALFGNNVSAVVVGEGEYTLLEIVKRSRERGGHLTNTDYESIAGIAFREDQGIIYSPSRRAIQDLNTLPLPDRSIYNMKLYPQGAIITSRGCSNACAFCSSADFWEKVTGKGEPRVRLRSASNVLEELTELKLRYGIDQFYILDDVFTVDRNRVIEICQGIIQRSLDVKWACLARGDQVDPEMLHLMKNSGCTQVHFGLESANNRTLQRIGKGITSEQIGEAIQWTTEAGMRTRVSIILGMPGDTESEVEETFKFIEQYRPNEVQFYALMPYPGSRWGNDPTNYGINILQPDSNMRIQSVYEPFAETILLPEAVIKQLADEGINRLEDIGYIHLTGRENKLKGRHEFTVSSAFTPIQPLEQYANISDYLTILNSGPLPYDDN